jgi:hypothetical protein
MMSMNRFLWLYLIFEIYIDSQFAIFLGTISMGDNHVASSTNWINPAAYNLFISCLIIVA